MRKGIADHDMNIQLFGPTNTTLNICNYQGQGTLMHGTRNTVSWRVDLIFFCSVAEYSNAVESYYLNQRVAPSTTPSRPHDIISIN